MHVSYTHLFRVGGSKGYVMFGDDVIPSSAGGDFTAVGRIVNSAPNLYGTYGFDQANYGLFIDVTGGTKNPSETRMNTNINNLLYMNDENKIIIYQVFTRLFGNNNNHCVYNEAMSSTPIQIGW